MGGTADYISVALLGGHDCLKIYDDQEAHQRKRRETKGEENIDWEEKFQ